MGGKLTEHVCFNDCVLAQCRGENNRVVFCSSRWEIERKPSHTDAVMVSCFQAMWLMMKPSHCF